MVQKIAVLGLAAVLVAGITLDAARSQEKKQEKKTGMLVGKIVSKKNSPNGKNVIIEVLAPGEQKPRPYRVQYDPKIKAPIKAVLESVRAAKVGERVQFEWIDTGEGLAITEFRVLRKEGDGADKR